MTITVNSPNGSVVLTREVCLKEAAGLLYSASMNLSKNGNKDLPTDVASSGMAAVQAQAALAQAFMMLHDRLIDPGPEY